MVVVIIFEDGVIIFTDCCNQVVGRGCGAFTTIAAKLCLFYHTGGPAGNPAWPLSDKRLTIVKS
jgi:hypothetical protein